MMTTQQNTRVYKVFYEQMKTGIIYNLVVEATNAVEAGEFVMSSVGEGYDLVKIIGAKKAELS